MRELSKSEMTAISGGVETITVVGIRPSSGPNVQPYYGFGTANDGSSDFLTAYDELGMEGSSTVLGVEQPDEQRFESDLANDPTVEAHTVADTFGTEITVYISVDGIGFWMPGPAGVYTYFGPPAMS